MPQNSEINTIISTLEAKHREDNEIIEEINRAKETIDYYMKQGDEKKALSEARQLEAYIHDWC